jgi:hypothetical protein
VVISQYAHFGLRSRRMPACDIAERLGIEPDEISVRGTKLVDPPIPSWHEWKVACRDSTVGVEEQVDRIVARLMPFAAEIGELAAHLEHDDGGGARLRIVRQFEADATAMDRAEADRDAAEALLSWHLNREVLRFLQITRADLDVDERR